VPPSSGLNIGICLQNHAASQVKYHDLPTTHHLENLKP